MKAIELIQILAANPNAEVRVGVTAYVPCPNGGTGYDEEYVDSAVAVFVGSDSLTITGDAYMRDVGERVFHTVETEDE